jgi:hypothetical protein
MVAASYHFADSDVVERNGRTTEPCGAPLKMPEKFATIADAEAYTPVSTPAFLETAGFYAAGDGGDALYANPVTVNPGKTDQIEINVNGTAA